MGSGATNAARPFSWVRESGWTDLSEMNGMLDGLLAVEEVERGGVKTGGWSNGLQGGRV